MQPGGGTDPLGREGGHSHQQPAQSSACAPTPAPAHTGLGLLHSVTRASWLPQPCGQRRRRRLQGRGGSAHPELHAAGKRHSLASPRCLEREQGRIKVNSKGRDGEERDGGMTGARQHTAASLCLPADGAANHRERGVAAVCVLVYVCDTPGEGDREAG